ncbi:MAG: hypothetical protein EA359_05220 [Balneolaceae bacterium]|jgi:hypothetical protein|nr:MAG: hypothetical protein EA359_05220 [Balneolaceae bacterium]
MFEPVRTNNYRDMKKLYFLIVPLLVLSLSACLESTPAEGPAEAKGEFEALLLDAETGIPLENFSVTVYLRVSGFTQPTVFGQFESDDSGWISSSIFSFTEDIITGIIIEYEVSGEIRSAERETELRLRYNEPMNSVSFEMELDIS